MAKTAVNTGIVGCIMAAAGEWAQTLYAEYSGAANVPNRLFNLAQKNT
jgi:hypothetical protein